MLSRQKGQVVVQQETIWSSAHGHIELARQIAGTIGCQQPRLDGRHQGAGIDDLLRIDPSQGIAGDVARVVVTRLATGEPHPLEHLHERCHVLQQEPPQLEVLAGGDVGAAVLAAAIDRLGQQLQLLGTNNAVGDAQPHHEAPRGHRAEKDAQPLQTHRERGFVKRFPAFTPHFGKPGSQIEAAELGLGLFDFAES